MRLNPEQSAVLARLLSEHPGRLSIEPCAGKYIGQGSGRAFTFADGYTVAVTVLGRVDVLPETSEGDR